MNSQGTPADGTEGAIQYLSSAAAQQQPFFMVVSLVNPHDVLAYPKTYASTGYDASWLDGEIEPPATVDEDLSTKPTVQEEFLRLFNASGPIPTREMKRNYLNFYANLMRSSDAYLVKILDTLPRTGMLDNTLVIATADHGEMGTAHGGLRQKNFNFYEESMRVPLVYSNPRLFKTAKTNHSLVSHVDFLPTLASLVGAPGRRALGLAGGRLLRADPQPHAEAGSELHRLHLRRLAVGAGSRALSQSAQSHRQHPRAALQDRPLLRRRGQGSRPVGDVRPQDRSAGARQPRPPGPQAHGRAGSPVQAPAAQARPRREDAAAAARLTRDLLVEQVVVRRARAAVGGPPGCLITRVTWIEKSPPGTGLRAPLTALTVRPPLSP